MNVRELIVELAKLPEHMKDKPVVFIEPYDTDPEIFEIDGVFTPDDESRVQLG